jgi:hypothetical protein
MKVYYNLKVFGDGKLKRKTRKYRSRSFLKPFLYIFGNSVGGISNVCSDIGGSSRNTNGIIKVSYPGLLSYVNPDNVGIQIGTGNTAVTLTDYKLQTAVLHGASANKMLKHGTYTRNFITGATTSSFDIECMFLNSSGGSITVKETGIYGYDNNLYYFCVLRDVLASTVQVDDNEYLLVTYTIQVAV